MNKKIYDGYKKIEEGVVEGYKKIEDGVVGGYKKLKKVQLTALIKFQINL